MTPEIRHSRCHLLLLTVSLKHATQPH